MAEPTKEELEQWACLASEQISLTPVAKCPTGSTLKNVKTIPRTLRVQVLDCRSGAPVPGAVLSGWNFEGDPNWDVLANYLVPVRASGKSAGQPLAPAGFVASDRRNLQRLLNALGFDCGKPSKTFGNQGFAALRQFQAWWYLQQGEDPDTQPFERRVTDEWQKRILEGYNRRFRQTIQFHLTLRGCPCLEDDGEWKEASVRALETFQKVELGIEKPLESFDRLADLARGTALAAAIQGSRKPLVSDANGIVPIPVEIDRVRRGFELRLSFRDFAICLEQKPVQRVVRALAAASYGVEWAPGSAGQDAKGTASGAFGWRLRPPGDARDAAQLPELRTYIDLEIPACEDLDWGRLHREREVFSSFYEGHTKEPPEYVVWALVWCQPVWDDLEDPNDPHTTSQKVYAQTKEDRHRRMHIVTLYRDLAGSEDYGGKGYGMLEFVTAPKWRSKDKPTDERGGHRGFDIYARKGDPVFALQGGTIRFIPGKPGSVSGNYAQVAGTAGAVATLHLSAFENRDLKRVRAGTLIGRAGRTGNLGEISANPTHVHLNAGANEYRSSVRDAIDAANQIVVPTNESPLAFPCACEVTLAEQNPEPCRFGVTQFASQCWAVAELCCPHMASPAQRERRIQAQLRHLFESQATSATNPYLAPGPLDGSPGPIPKKEGDRVPASRAAIHAFRVANGLPEGFEIDADAEARLDALAPLVEPEGG